MDYTCTYRLKYIALAALSGAVAFSITPCVDADDGPGADQSAGASPMQLSEVKVTAEKQVGTEQETPISMAVEPAEELIDRGIVDVTALLQETPGVSLKSNGPGQTEF